MSEDQPDAPILLSTSDAPVPDNHSAGHFSSFDGRRLRYAIFRSTVTVARGTVVILQGRNECIEKYYETIRHFTGRGLWVATFDWRGQGGSDRLLKDRRRGHVRRMADYERDLMIFLETIVLPETRLPFCLIAHSMGSLIALSAAPQLTNRIERMALVAPFIDMSGQPAPPWVIRLLTSVACLAGLGWITFDRDRFPRPFPDNVLTSDQTRFDRNQGLYAAHPDLRLGPPTVRWVQVMLKAIARVNRVEHLNAIAIPTLLISAGKDQIVSPRSVEAFANRFRAGSVIPIEGARHELLQEADRYRLATLAAIDAFIPPDQGIGSAASS